MKPYSKNKYAYNWHWFWDTGNGDIGNQGPGFWPGKSQSLGRLQRKYARSNSKSFGGRRPWSRGCPEIC